MKTLLKRKKGIAAAFVAVVVFTVLLILSPAESGDDLSTANTDIVIQPDTFLKQVDEIAANPSEYVGKTITIQGIYSSMEINGQTIQLVYRIDPGCCGDDGPMHGFAFHGTNETVRSGQWITVSGRLAEDPNRAFGSLVIEDSTVSEAPRGERVAHH